MKTEQATLGSSDPRELMEIGRKDYTQLSWNDDSLGGIDYVRKYQLAHGNNYTCPKCGGGFDVWDKKDDGLDEIDVCPFCGLERRSYEPED